tara:strand:- start:1575 stop:1700 length:126 start_codon:yes stop_codon:yes gene_type:complete
MTREEFFEWLGTCPTHKWNIIDDEHGYVRVSFPTHEEEEEE